MIVEDEVVFDPIPHTYTDKAGLLVPGVTTILKTKGWIDTTHYREEHRLRGSAVHLAIHYLEKGTLDPFSIDPIVEPYVQSYERFKASTGFKVLYHEKVVFNPTYRYAGSLDCVGLLNGQEVLLDFKTGDVQPWASLQLSAYNACLPRPVSGLRKRFGLRLYGDASIAELVPFNDPHDETIFFSEVAGFYAMLKKGLIKLANLGDDNGRK